MQAFEDAALIKDDGLGADETSASVADGEGDGGYERGLMEDDSVVTERVVDAQVVAAGDKLTITVDAEVGNVVGGKAAVAVKCGREVVDAEADIVRCAAWVDDGALPGGERLIKGETGQGVTEVDQGSRQNMASGAIGWESVPLRHHTGHKQGDEGGVKDKGGQGSP